MLQLGFMPSGSHVKARPQASGSTNSSTAATPACADCPSQPRLQHTFFCSHSRSPEMDGPLPTGPLSQIGWMGKPSAPLAAVCRSTSNSFSKPLSI
ncbi:hypothetical protein AAFF_G00424740 [Aldrovandia affinis]|uniref:Uncharacterized protein n=1 Tax=Aldrovandia affinis TaxID=143900 RepID=A0AAD7T6R6_9TELE|nr:hypothetical protein AAFF_G00424740 [Aldrovandia affinis]